MAAFGVAFVARPNGPMVFGHSEAAAGRIQVTGVLGALLFYALIPRLVARSDFSVAVVMVVALFLS